MTKAQIVTVLSITQVAKLKFGLLPNFSLDSCQTQVWTPVWVVRFQLIRALIDDEPAHQRRAIADDELAH
jgi:hypothetical protein